MTAVTKESRCADAAKVLIFKVAIHFRRYR